MTAFQRRAARDWSPNGARIQRVAHRQTVQTRAGAVPVVITEAPDANGFALYTIYAFDANGSRRILYPTNGETVWLASPDGADVRAVEPWLAPGSTPVQAGALAAGILHGTAALFLDAACLFGTPAPPTNGTPSGDGAATADDRAPILRLAGADRAPLRTARAATERAAAPNPREGLRRLLNVRCTAWGKHVGTLGAVNVEPRDCADRMRHEAVREAPNGRTESSMDRSVTEAEMADAVTYVEHWLYETGYDLDADDAAYAARRETRAAGA